MKKFKRFGFCLLLAPLVSWALGAQALWAQGHLGFLGLGKEGSWGTAVAATDYVELMSEGISTTRDRFPTRNIYAGFYEADDYAGMFRSAGSTVQDGNPVSIGHLLKAVFNNSSVSVIASGALWALNFTGTHSEFADGVPRQPYTLEVNRDVTSSFQYSGAIANKLTMALAPNQGLRTTVEWIAKSRSLIAKTTPTFVSSPVDPFTFDTASISLGGSATARIEALTVAIDNRLEGIPALNNSNTIARVRAIGPQMIRISGTLDFVDVTEEEDFVSQTERALVLNLTRADSFSMRIDAPRFVYSAFPVGMSGPGRQTISFDGIARYLQSSLAAIGVQLTTTKSNF
jgi:hypothetical protein